MWPFTKHTSFSYQKVDAARSRESNEDSSDGCSSCVLLELQLASTQRTNRFLKTSLAVSNLVLVLVAAASVLMHATKTNEYVSNNTAQQHLGSDPNGFVPTSVGEPPRWTYFAHDSPYFIPEDTFSDLGKTRDVVKRIKAVHNSSTVLVNGHTADWVHPDGTVSKLPMDFSPVSLRQTYTIRGLYQLECLVTIAEAYGHRANNQTSQHSHADVAHCVNTVREAIMCLADATPVAFVNGFGSGRITDDQQVMCRDWTALRRWANDAKRGVRYVNVASEGSGRDDLTEIIPFPELTEMERMGLA